MTKLALILTVRPSRQDFNKFKKITIITVVCWCHLNLECSTWKANADLTQVTLLCGFDVTIFALPLNSQFYRFLDNSKV